MADRQADLLPGILQAEVEQARRTLFALFADPSEEAPTQADKHIQAFDIDLEACDAERIQEFNADTLPALAFRHPDPAMLDVLLLRSSLFKSIDAASAGSALLAEAVRQGASKRMMLKAWRLCQTADSQDIHGYSPLGRAIEVGARTGDLSAAVFLLERGADPAAPALMEEDAHEMARSIDGPGADAVRELLAAPLSHLANAHLQRSVDFDRDFAEALSKRDFDGARLAADKGGVVRWGSLGEAQEAAAFEAADAACEAREILREILAEGSVECARLFLLETSIARSELFLEALAARCPSEEIFDLAIGGFRETAYAGPGEVTLLHEAVNRRNIPAIRALLRRGADSQSGDLYGQTPLRMAIDTGDKALIAAISGLGESSDSPADVKVGSLESPPRGAEQIEVFSKAAISMAEGRMAGTDAERKRGFDKAIARMKHMDGHRVGAPAPAPDRIKSLAVDYPTFSEVIDMVAERAITTAKAAAKAGKPRAFKLPNILLVGKPGMGKTHFLKKLAEALGTSYQMIQMGATSAGFVLAGMDSGWSGAKPGKIFDSLAEGTCANPVLALDEIDKISRSDQHPVNGPLFALLERGTAKDWRDEFVDVPMDTSYINYVATANDASSIDEAILSRFDVFEIPDPDQDEAERIARSVYKEVLAREGWGDLFDPELASDVLERLAACTPREAHILLGQALPKACAKGRDRLELADFKSQKPSKQGIGFF